jgi:hypothetical protein
MSGNKKHVLVLCESGRIPEDEHAGLRRCLSSVSATDLGTIDPILASLAEYECVSGRREEKHFLTGTFPL